ncbi:hypothetical protein D3273_01195 [Lichenibacterium minor]|uniref:DUF5343 domain-containing protein n=1 Tax=Lichenibacterium minor TaxID=2316528 RepID=A0A4Q2UF93_9HYPH|nr:hypothetical protein [Lichenibacterium minor]RYC33897.1 hypothetical protein D3273_01195 [Lichenibacterium minor]
MAHIRSPNYPSISLAEALERVKKVHDRERQHSTARDVVMKWMGYGSSNGASLGALSAARKFGLLERLGKGEEYKVSDRAVAIFHPHTLAEKAEALDAAARAPALFAELLDHYKGSLPSDESIRAYLIRRGFTQGSLGGVVQSFRETMALAQNATASYPSNASSRPETGEEEEEEEEESVPAIEQAPAQRRPPNLDGPMKVSFTGGSVEVSAILTDAEAVDNLVRALEAMKGLLPKPKNDEAAH